MKRRSMTVAAATLLVGGLLHGLTSPAQAAGAIQFSGAQYNSPGSDTGSNSSLNGEWVRITNSSSAARVLTGWKLRDVTGYLFTFPTFTLGAGKSVKVHTGKGTNTRTDLYWRMTKYVWNNTGDRATLMNKSGVVIDTCSWGNGPGYISC